MADRHGHDGPRRDGDRLVEGHGPPGGPARGEPRDARARSSRAIDGEVDERVDARRRRSSSSAGATDHAAARSPGPSSIGAGLRRSRVDDRSRRLARARRAQIVRSTIARLDRDGGVPRRRTCDGLAGSILGRNVEVRHSGGGRRAPTGRRRPEPGRGGLASSASRARVRVVDRRAAGAGPAPDRGGPLHRPRSSDTCRPRTRRRSTSPGTCTCAGRPRSRRRFRGVGAEPDGDSASRFPARVFEPVASGLGVPRLEWLAGRFDSLLATNFLPPPTSDADGVVLVVHDLAFEHLPGDRAAPRRAMAPAVRSTGSRARAGVIVPSRGARDDLVGRPRGGPAIGCTSSSTASTRRRSAGRATRPSTRCARATAIAGPVRAVRRRPRAAEEPRALVRAFGRAERDGRRARDRRRRGALGARATRRARRGDRVAAAGPARACRAHRLRRRGRHGWRC